MRCNVFVVDPYNKVEQGVWGNIALYDYICLISREPFTNCITVVVEDDMTKRLLLLESWTGSAATD